MDLDERGSLIAKNKVSLYDWITVMIDIFGSVSHILGSNPNPMSHI